MGRSTLRGQLRYYLPTQQPLEQGAKLLFNLYQHAVANSRIDGVSSRYATSRLPSHASLSQLLNAPLCPLVSGSAVLMSERHSLSDATSVSIKYYEDDEVVIDGGVDVRAAETYEVASEAGGGRYVAEGEGVWVATADVDDVGNVAPGGAVLRPDVAPLLPACDPAHLHTLKGAHITPTIV